MADRSNHRLNEEIESHIRQWDGTIHGQMVKKYVRKRHKLRRNL